MALHHAGHSNHREWEREHGLGQELPHSPPISFRKMDANVLAKCKAAMKCSLCEPQKEKWVC